MKIYIAKAIKGGDASTDNIFVVLSPGRCLNLFSRPKSETRWKTDVSEQSCDIDDWKEQWEVREITEMEVESMVFVKR
jgi:hypothetical protein